MQNFNIIDISLISVQLLMMQTFHEMMDDKNFTGHYPVKHQTSLTHFDEAIFSIEVLRCQSKIL